MKRSGPPQRRTGIRSQSKRRGGTSRTTIKQLDELWKRAVRLRDGGFCQKPGCGSTDYVQGHHVYTCRIQALRWNIDNGILLCRGHHKFWAHQHSQAFHAWWVERVGAETAEALDIVARMKTKAPLDKEAHKLFLEAEVRRLET